MKRFIGDVIFATRREQKLTQDQYGAKYGISGPAVFKFEKNYVRPSLNLWLRMAKDAGMAERRAVLLWVKNRLPEPYDEYIDLQSVAVAERQAGYAKSKKGRKPDYAKIDTREEMREVAEKDQSLPSGLGELLADDELWALYKPTGHEINTLRDIFGPLGRGSKASFREALRVIRDFAHSF